MKALIKLAVLGAAVFAIFKLRETKRYFMVGTEDELRDRVRGKFADRVPPEKLSEVEDKVVEFARDKGTLVEAADVSPNGEGATRPND